MTGVQFDLTPGAAGPYPAVKSRVEVAMPVDARVTPDAGRSSTAAPSTAAVPATMAAPVCAQPVAPLLEGLGTHQWVVTTKVPRRAKEQRLTEKKIMSQRKKLRGTVD